MRNTDAKILVFNALRVGKEHALSRQQLVIRTGIDDRQVRKAIEELRREYPILVIPGGNGYYIPRNDESGKKEAGAWISQQRKREKSICASQEGAIKFCRGEPRNSTQIPGQMNMFGGVEIG